jgi:transcription antitermination protein NusB
MSSGKRKSRQLAMQVLFSWDVQGDKNAAMAEQIVSDGSEDSEVRQRALEMAAAAWEGRETADQWVARLAPQWPTHRQPSVDRNLLRLAIWELIHAAAPPKVVLDEAIELAKLFSTEQSPAFVNAVLDAVLKEHQKTLATEGTENTENPKTIIATDKNQMHTDEENSKSEI